MVQEVSVVPTRALGEPQGAGRQPECRATAARPPQRPWVRDQSACSVCEVPANLWRLLNRWAARRTQARPPLVARAGSGSPGLHELRRERNNVDEEEIRSQTVHGGQCRAASSAARFPVRASQQRQPALPLRSSELTRSPAPPHFHNNRASSSTTSTRWWGGTTPPPRSPTPPSTA
jgi:hypothetical protein